MNVQREFLILKGVKHPNIVELVDFIHDNSTCYLVLEYMAGGKLPDTRLYMKP